MKQEYNKNYLQLFIVMILALEAILFYVGNLKLDTVFLDEQIKMVRIQNELSNVPVEAKAVSVYDVDSNVELYGKDQNESLPLASLVKTMTVLVSLSSNEPGHIITISQNAIKQDGNYGFFTDEKWKIENLAKFTLIGSANDGAYALSDNDPNFIEKMNDKAKRIGMEHALFSNPTGLDIDDKKAGAYASALDVNIMAAFALKAYPNVFLATVLPEMNIKSESGFNHDVKNTDLVLNKINNLYFSKTGFTDVAGGNLTIIFKNKSGHEIAVTVLGSTLKGRFSDMEKLVNISDTLHY